MLYLSKLLLNPRNPGAWRDAARPYELHRTLMRGADGDARLLFRLEQNRHGPTALVQTQSAQTQWPTLINNNYLLDVYGPKPFIPTLAPRQRLRFRLVANPTVKLKKPGRKHGVRVPLVHAGANPQGYQTYFDWLHRKAKQHGFRVLRVQDAPFRTASGRTHKPTYAKAKIRSSVCASTDCSKSPIRRPSCRPSRTASARPKPSASGCFRWLRYGRKRPLSICSLIY